MTGGRSGAGHHGHGEGEVELDHCDGWRHAGLGDVLATERKFNSARAEFPKAIELDASEPAPHNKLAVPLRKQDERKVARSEARKAREVEAKLRPKHRD